MPRITDRSYSPDKQYKLKTAISRIVAFIRQEKGLSNTEISSKMGFSLSHFKRLKNPHSTTNLTSHNIGKITKFLEMSEDEILYISESETLCVQYKSKVVAAFSYSAAMPVEKQYLLPSDMIDKFSCMIRVHGENHLKNRHLYKNVISFWRSLENTLTNKFFELTVLYIKSIVAKNFVYTGFSDNEFCLDGCIFILDFLEEPGTQSFVIKINKRSDKRDFSEKMCVQTYLLPDNCKHHRIKLLLHRSLSSYLDVIEPLIVEGFKYIYDFLDDTAIGRTFHSPINVVDHLYTGFRSEIGHGIPFWLYLMHGDGAVYLLDQQKKIETLESIKGKGKGIGLSRSECVTCLWGQKSDSNDVIDTKVVIPQNQTISYHPINDAKIMSHISYPQHLMTGTENMRIQPIVGTEIGNIFSDDRVSWLTVVYPDIGGEYSKVEDAFNNLRIHTSAVLSNASIEIKNHLREDSGWATP